MKPLKDFLNESLSNNKQVKERATKVHFRNFIETFGDDFQTWKNLGSDREVNTLSLMNATILSYNFDSYALELRLDNGESYYSEVEYYDLPKSEFNRMKETLDEFFA